MKSVIDHSNYEAYLLDRAEGTLSREELVALNAFLIAHPELDAGMEQLPTIEGKAIPLPEGGKKDLERSLPPKGMPSTVSIDDFLIARTEIDLTREQLQALDVFLEKHPEYAPLAKRYEAVKLGPVEAPSFDKRVLIRELPPVGMPHEHTLEDHLVARLEGDLDSEQRRMLDRIILSDPDVARTWRIFQQTKVKATTDVFPFKGQLKKASVIPIHRIYRDLAIAASFLVLLGIGWWALRSSGTPEERIAEVASPEVSGIAADKDPIDALDPAQELHISEEDDSPEAVSKGPEDPVLSDPIDGVRMQRHTTSSMELIAVRVPEAPLGAPAPRTMIVPDVPAPGQDPQLELASVEVPVVSEVDLGGLIASTIREKVLDQMKPDTRPMDEDDAVAMVDRGLKVVAGDRAGLEVTRKESGELRGFDLRLGRTLSIRAGR